MFNTDILNEYIIVYRSALVYMIDFAYFVQGVRRSEK
jgi:hypothetical protein